MGDSEHSTSKVHFVGPMQVADNSRWQEGRSAVALKFTTRLLPYSRLFGCYSRTCHEVMNALVIIYALVVESDLGLEVPEGVEVEPEFEVVAYCMALAGPY